jgi:hypothetical protein
MADPDIVLRGPASAANVVLTTGGATTPALWVNTASGSKRATAIYVNTSGGAKLLTDLAVNTSGGRKDIVFS